MVHCRAQKKIQTSDSARAALQILSNIQQADTLKSRLRKAKEDTTIVNLYNDLSKLYCIFLYDSAILYSSKARKLSNSIQYPAGLVHSLINRGYADEIMKSNWDTAIIYYQKAIETARGYKLEEMFDFLFSIIHNAYVYQGNFPLAMTIANQGLAEAKKRNDKKQILHYTSLVAASYFRQNLYDKALVEYEKAKLIAANLGKDERSALNLVTLADIYYGLGDLYAAKNDYPQALYNLEKAFTGFTELEKDTFFIRHYMLANTLFKTGVVKRAAGSLPDALMYALAALDYCKRGGCNPYEKVGYYLLAGDVQRQMGKLPEARKFLYEAVEIAEKIRHAENARDSYYYLSLYYADEKKFDSAWYFNQRYALLKDSVTNERTRFRTEEINTIYGIAEKDKEIARQGNLRNILIASFLVLLLTLWFLYNRYRLRQRNRYQQDINRRQNELFNAIASAQEQERKRIAQDIHDGLGSVLSAVKLKMSEIKEMRPQLGADEKFLTGIGLIDEASAELRNISHNIMPATLSKLGLVPALKNLTEKISSHKGLQIIFIAHGMEQRLDEQSEISIYRIILELINNVVKHADAGKASVQLIGYPDYVNLTVEDNGRGFQLDKPTYEKTGIGLANVTERVKYLNGKMHIDSMPGRGTTVVIDIPIQE